MKNWSLQFKIQAVAYFYTLLLLILLGAVFWEHGFQPFYLAFAAISIVYAAFVITGTPKLLAPITKISKVAEEVSRGSFDTRVTHIQSNDELGQLSWQINDMPAFARSTRLSNTPAKASISEKRIRTGSMEHSATPWSKSIVRSSACLSARNSCFAMNWRRN
jgi:HAMP domain-containing protein